MACDIFYDAHIVNEEFNGIRCYDSREIRDLFTRRFNLAFKMTHLHKFLSAEFPLDSNIFSYRAMCAHGERICASIFALADSPLRLIYNLFVIYCGISFDKMRLERQLTSAPNES